MKNILYPELTVQGAVTYQQLPKEFPEDKTSETTPDVSNRTILTVNNSGAKSITDFKNGQSGQTIRLLALDNNTTIVNGTSIKTNTGADKLLSPNKVYRFTYYNNVWYEDA